MPQCRFKKSNATSKKHEPEQKKDGRREDEGGERKPRVQPCVPIAASTALIPASPGRQEPYRSSVEARLKDNKEDSHVLFNTLGPLPFPITKSERDSVPSPRCLHGGGLASVAPSHQHKPPLPVTLPPSAAPRVHVNPRSCWLQLLVCASPHSS